MMADEEVQPNATFVHCTPYGPAVYVRNLNEKIKIPTLIESLREIFGEVGDVVDIIAKQNLKARGQAFVVFDSTETAQSAIEDLQGFDLFEKPMQLSFAKTRSDATVLRENGDNALETHKRHRLAEKERKQALEASKPTNKRPAPAGGAGDADRPTKAKLNPAGLIADEYLPPNKTLVLRELPPEYTKEQLSVVFGRYPGFREVRMVPGRAGIAFAEYEDETGAIAAKEAMNGVALGEKSIRVTYQRQ